MISSNVEVADIVNDLIEINNDRIEGYDRAVKETEDPSLKSLFREMAQRSRQFKNELSTESRKFGEEPADGTRNTGKIFRAWMDIKAVITGNDSKAILNSCERGEDAARDAYDAALNSETGLPEHIGQMIAKQRQQIQKDHDRIKSLRDTVRS